MLRRAKENYRYYLLRTVVRAQVQRFWGQCNHRWSQQKIIFIRRTTVDAQPYLIFLQFIEHQWLISHSHFISCIRRNFKSVAHRLRDYRFEDFLPTRAKMCVGTRNKRAKVNREQIKPNRNTIFHSKKWKPALYFTVEFLFEQIVNYIEIQNSVIF